MDVVLLFMRLEDKYWGLFLVALFFLFLYAQNRKQEKGTQTFLLLSVYGLVAYLLFLCPWIYEWITKLVPVLSDYYTVSHVQLVVPVLSIAGATALLLAENEGKGKRISLLIGLTALLYFAGDFAYLPSQEDGWKAKASSQEVEIFDLILEHAHQRGEEGKAYIWGMEEIMAKCRLYDAMLCPVYGKDIATVPEKYNEAQNMLYQGYARYDISGGTAINVSDQFDALALLPYQYEQEPCEYVILYDPKTQFEDYKEYFKKKEFDAVGHFSALGYEHVGSTKTMLLFYKKKG